MGYSSINIQWFLCWTKGLFWGSSPFLERPNSSIISGVRGRHHFVKVGSDNKIWDLSSNYEICFEQQRGHSIFTSKSEGSSLFTIEFPLCFDNLALINRPLRQLRCIPIAGSPSPDLFLWKRDFFCIAFHQKIGQLRPPNVRL